MTSIRVKGEQEGSYQDVGEGWYGEVVNDNSYIEAGTKVRVVHQSDLPFKTTGAGPLGLFYGGNTLTVEEEESDQEGIRVFKKK